MQSPGYQEALRQAQEMAAEQGLRQDYYSSSYSSTSGGSSRTYTNTGYGSAGYENSGETALPEHFCFLVGLEKKQVFERFSLPY